MSDHTYPLQPIHHWTSVFSDGEREWRDDGKTPLIEGESGFSFYEYDGRLGAARPADSYEEHAADPEPTPPGGYVIEVDPTQGFSFYIPYDVINSWPDDPIRGSEEAYFTVKMFFADEPIPSGQSIADYAENNPHTELEARLSFFGSGGLEGSGDWNSRLRLRAWNAGQTAVDTEDNNELYPTTSGEVFTDPGGDGGYVSGIQVLPAKVEMSRGGSMPVELTINPFDHMGHDPVYLVGLQVELSVYSYLDGTFEGHMVYEDLGTYDFTAELYGGDVAEEDRATTEPATQIKLYKYRSGTMQTVAPAPTDSGGTQPGGTTGSSTPPKLCQPNTDEIQALRQSLYEAGVVDDPSIPVGYPAILRDGWEWLYTGSGWQASQYLSFMDMRDEPDFECA